MDVFQSKLQAELGRSSNYATRGTLKLRVLFDLAKTMGVSRSEIYETQDCVHVDPSVSAAVENLWNGGTLIGDPVVEDAVATADDGTVLERFLARDFLKPIDVVKMTTALLRRSPSHLRNLWCLFAADGLAVPCDRLERYFDHLTVPLALGERFESEEEDWREAHVRAVRTVYRDVSYATPEKVGATLRVLLDLETGKKGRRRRGDGSSSPSSESSGGDDDDDEDYETGDLFDRYVADLYKRLVGKKILSIAYQKRGRPDELVRKEVEKITKPPKKRKAKGESEAKKPKPEKKKSE